MGDCETCARLEQTIDLIKTSLEILERTIEVKQKILNDRFIGIVTEEISRMRFDLGNDRSRLINGRSVLASLYNDYGDHLVRHRDNED